MVSTRSRSSRRNATGLPLGRLSAATLGVGLAIACHALLPYTASATSYGDLPSPCTQAGLAENGYVGWWCPADEAGSVIAVDGTAYQLQIVGQTADHVVLNISCTSGGAEVGSANAMGTITAPLVDGKASFSFCDGQGRIYDGSLELADGEINLGIAETDAYQTLMPYAAASLAADGTFLRDPHHGSKTDSIGWAGSELQPSTAWEVLDEQMLAYLSPLMLELSRDEIYARHGCVFADDELNGYFSSKAWYTPSIDADQFGEDVLSEAEATNVARLSDQLRKWESMSSGTTFVATGGTYSSVQYGDPQEDMPAPDEIVVSFDEPGMVTMGFGRLGDESGDEGDKTVVDARITDDAEAVFDVEGGQIVVTWSGPGMLFMSWRGTGEIPQAWSDLIYQSFRNNEYVAVG